MVSQSEKIYISGGFSAFKRGCRRVTWIVALVAVHPHGFLVMSWKMLNLFFPWCFNMMPMFHEHSPVVRVCCWIRTCNMNIAAWKEAQARALCAQRSQRMALIKMKEKTKPPLSHAVDVDIHVQFTSKNGGSATSADIAAGFLREWTQILQGRRLPTPSEWCSHWWCLYILYHMKVQLPYVCVHNCIIYI